MMAVHCELATVALQPHALDTIGPESFPIRLGRLRAAALKPSLMAGPQRAFLGPAVSEHPPRTVPHFLSGLAISEALEYRRLLYASEPDSREERS